MPHGDGRARFTLKGGIVGHTVTQTLVAATARTFALSGFAKTMEMVSESADPPEPACRNIQKTPTVGTQIGRQRTQMRAHIATAQERARLWPLVNRNNSNRYDAYQAKTTRTIPLVILSPV